ncbi:MAG: HD domain-containing protein [Gammaproteobacteria bacterium]
MNIERWDAMLRELGATPETSTFLQLQSVYAQKHRHYHTSRHINECISIFDEVKHLAEHPAEVECALWFHDAIYEPMAKSNEERSANWAAEFGRRTGMAGEVAARIHAHIMSTRHLLPSKDGDSGLTVDIDLSILGASTSRYDEFERDVRREYRWIPGFIYNPKRTKILQSFLNRPRIYHWELMYERFERNARANLAGAIRALMGIS